MPNRKQRNQRDSNRVYDIEFATEISSSLILQVRNLQAALAERDEELKDVKHEQSQLQLEAEALEQRLKTLDESEHRYKEENWNLETRLREQLALLKDATDKEKKLSQSLGVLQSDKSATQRELDEVKDALAKHEEKHAAAIKSLEIDLGTSRRNAVMAEAERASMQRKIDELTSQNQELAKAFSMQRGRAAAEREAGYGPSEDEFQSATDNATPEHSPPPSPIKGTPRHSMLESETLKTSLGHAQRTIQTLRTNIHREKTEKLELKRMLQDARDELEKMRNDPNLGSRRNRKAEAKEAKRTSRLGQLGGHRTSRTELVVEDPDWEDQGEVSSPLLSHSLSPATSTIRLARSFEPIVESSSDHFDTANETSDAAFETAHERGTETEDFQTGAEELSDDDGETETEASPSKGSSRIKRPPVLPMNHSSGRYSFESTASTSDDDADSYNYHDLRTPTAMPSQKMRLRVSRGNLSRRSRQFSEEPALQSSPASHAVSSTSGTPQQAGQSLFAELGDFEGGSDDDSYAGVATPSRRSVRSLTPGSFARGRASPPPEVPALPRVIMVDSGMMTEPVQIGPISAGREEDQVASPVSVIFGERPMSMESVIGPRDSFSRPLSSISYSDASVQNDADFEAKLAQFPSPPTSPPRLGLPNKPILSPPEKLSTSHIHLEDIEPYDVPSSPPSLGMSSVLTADSLPLLEPEEPTPKPSLQHVASFVSQHVEPEHVAEPDPVEYKASRLSVTDAEPVVEPEPAPPAPPALHMPSLVFSDVAPEATESPVLQPKNWKLSTIYEVPLEPLEQPAAEQESDRLAVVPVPELLPLVPVSVPLSFASVVSGSVEPEDEPAVVPAPLSLALATAEQVEPLPMPVPKLGVSFAYGPQTEPVEALTTPPPTLRISMVESRDVKTIEAPVPEVVSPQLLHLATVQALEGAPVEPISDELTFAQIEALASEPLSPRSPKRNGFIIPRDMDADYVPRSDPPTPSKLPLVPTLDQGAQTTLTSAALDEILRAKDQPFESSLVRSNSSTSIGTPSTVRIHRPRQSSTDSTRRAAKGKAVGILPSNEDTSAFRPVSSSSSRHRDLPPLPANHRQVIEAARTGSSGGGQGSMGPPLFPASALKSQQQPFRPRTPNGAARPMSPVSLTSGRETPTPRIARAGSALGTAEAHSPMRLTHHHSRKSSVSSFVSEIDSRFNMPPDGPFEPGSFGSNTDPRMIQAITQTMIGEYLWKYTRKPGRGELSGNRHRRYFWVHPYTRTLYWSDRDPASAGRHEVRAKSVPIEAVVIVDDDNPMPPGLHRKSLIVTSPGRSIKFTCTTGQRHETWSNALSYLLSRTDPQTNQSDAEDMAGNITREDVEEFNPAYGRHIPNGTRVAPSLSSYNSRTVRNESPIIDMAMEFPTLTPTPKRGVPQQRPSVGTMSRISGYWKDSKVLSSTFGSLRSRSVSGRTAVSDICETSEAHDSAEDLRHTIEKQDREADRLENVRACCDGE